MIRYRALLLAILSLIPGGAQAGNSKQEEGRMPFRGALVYKYDAEQPIANEAQTQLTFSHAAYDTDGFYNSTTGRFVIPAGVSKVKLKAQIIWANNGTGFRQLVIKKNFVNGDFSTGWFPGVPATTVLANPNTTTDVSVAPPAIPVTEGDNFLAEAFQNSGASLDARKSVGTWFSIEVVE